MSQKSGYSGYVGYSQQQQGFSRNRCVTAKLRAVTGHL